MSEVEWQLFYWPTLPGRGDYVRLMFEEAGVAYEDVGRVDKGVDEVRKYYLNQHEGNPVAAPPIIRHKTDGFVMCATPAILVYLGEKFEMSPGDTAEERAYALQIVSVVTDAHGEGHDVYHPVEKTGSYASQKEEAKPHIERYLDKRLPRYLGILESILKRHNDGKEFFLGNKITYVDIAVFQFMRAVESQFPEKYKEYPIPLLRGFKERIAARPRIAAYLQSDRCMPFCGNSMM